MSGALELTIALPGLQSLTVGLSRYRADIADWSTFWREKFAPFFYRWVLTDFVLEGGGSGATWAPLSPAYAAWKAKHYPGTGLLVRSGALKASLAGPEAPQAIFRPTTTSLTIGTSVPYGLPHQTGTSRMPQRPPLRVNAAFMQVVGKQLQLTIQEAWVKRRAEMGATPAAA
jgi:phage gpG-like protein